MTDFLAKTNNKYKQENVKVRKFFGISTFDTANVTVAHILSYEYTVLSSPMEQIPTLKNTGCHEGQSLF